jgi:hypothetical protein
MNIMEEVILEKVKECAISYLGVQKEDIVSVAEVFKDATTQGFEVRVQKDEAPLSQQCFVLVKDGEASILATKENGDKYNEQQH